MSDMQWTVIGCTLLRMRMELALLLSLLALCVAGCDMKTQYQKGYEQGYEFRGWRDSVMAQWEPCRCTTFVALDTIYDTTWMHPIGFNQFMRGDTVVNEVLVTGTKRRPR